MSEYIPTPVDWVRKHVELYEGSGGKKGVTLPGSELPCIIGTHKGNKTGALRKTPLMRVKVGEHYVLIGSMGGAPKNPVWVYNLRSDSKVEIRDGTEVHKMRAREVTNDEERAEAWTAGVAAFPPYKEYQEKTSRKIPVFVAELR